MIVQILQENLLKSLVRAGRIVPSKPQLPVLQNVLLSVESGRFKITATNLEYSETIYVNAKVQEEGGICVSSRLFTEFVSSLPQATVSLSTKEGSVVVSCGAFNATIPGTPREEFPTVATSRGNNITLDKKAFADSLGRVAFSAATDEGRPLLTGIKIAHKDGETTLAATDGYRLSVKTETLVSGGDLDLLVPVRAINEVLKARAEEKEEKEIHMSKPLDGQLSFSIGDTEIRTRLIDGDYPNFRKIIPSKYNTRVFVEKDSLARAVKSAAIFARDSANIVRLQIGGQSITVSANAPQIGEDEVEVEAKIEGEGGEMAFNSRFLLDFLSNFPEEEVVFEMTGSLNPGVFKSAKDDTYLHIIMPVRVQG